MPPQPPVAVSRTARRDGVLVVDKPAGPTSHDVVAVVRRRFHGVKVGHTGTLDPLATGVLPIVIGRATRLARYLSAGEKEYDAFIRLGRATDTYDAAGRVVFEAPSGRPLPATGTVAALLDDFRGTWMQTPPPYSAKLADGVRAYDHARRGERVELPPVEVTVSGLELLSYEDALLRIRLVSSAGFYVRALAHEIGRRLGTGALLEALRRLRSGPFGLDGAVTLDRVAAPGIEERVLPLEALLPDWPAVGLTASGVEWAAHGRQLGPAQCATGMQGLREGDAVRLVGPDGALVGLAAVAGRGVLHPAVVLM